MTCSVNKGKQNGKNRLCTFKRISPLSFDTCFNPYNIEEFFFNGSPTLKNHVFDQSVLKIYKFQKIGGLCLFTSFSFFI